jgi:hypothetical protein
VRRYIRHGHESGDPGLRAGDLEDPVAAVLLAQLGGRPAEDRLVEPLCGVGVRRRELVPDEDALRHRALLGGLVGADERSLRVLDDPDPADLAHLERAGGERATGSFRLLDRLVEALDADVAQPVGRRRALERLAVPTVRLAAGRDHGVVELTGLEHLGLPAEQLRVEALRLVRIGRDLLVPDELAER